MTGREWLIILGMVVVTFGIRYILFALADRITMPELMEASLNYIPPAVLVAITVPAVLMPRGEWHLSLANGYLVAAIVATVAGLLTKNLLVTIAIGLLAFFGHQVLF
jgi:branched-subunit amino acid transport protein